MLEAEHLVSDTSKIHQHSMAICRKEILWTHCCSKLHMVLLDGDEHNTEDKDAVRALLLLKRYVSYVISRAHCF